MAVTRVTRTSNGRAALRYALEEPSHKEGMDRVLMASGVNLDPKFAMLQMATTWQTFNKTHGEQIQVYRIIQSFGLDELDPNNPEDIIKANEIGNRLAHELYPDRQCAIVTHGDGEGGKLHNHIIVNSIDFTTGKALRGDAKEWTTIRDKSDEILPDFGLTPLSKEKAKNSRSIGELKQSAAGKYVWKDDLKKRIEESLNDPYVIDQETFIEDMGMRGIEVRFRGKKGVSYGFKDKDDKERVSRGGKLGTSFDRSAVEETFSRNLQQMELDEKETKEWNAKHGMGEDFIFNPSLDESEINAVIHSAEMAVAKNDLEEFSGGRFGYDLAQNRFMDLQKNAACSSAEVIQNYLKVSAQGVYYDEGSEFARIIGFLQSDDQTICYNIDLEDDQAVTAGKQLIQAQAAQYAAELSQNHTL